MEKNVVKEMYLEIGVGKKTGRPYYRLVTVFSNGYTHKCFLSDEQNFILSSILETRAI